MEQELFPLAATVILGWGIPGAIILVAIILQYKKRKKYYESLTKALELGKSADEIKEIFSIEKQPKERNGTGFLKGGIVVMGLGIGVAMIGIFVPDVGLFASAAFVIVLGLSLIAVYLLTKKNYKTK